MDNSPKLIKNVYISTPGDASVGLPGESAVIKADGDFLIDLDGLDEADISEVIETFRQHLIHTFTALWCDTPRVVFDFEQVD